MKNKRIASIAAEDASQWAAAEMFYGKGAGTRRKLLDAELAEKYAIPGYYEAFVAAYEDLDMDWYAKNAIKERQRIDRSEKVDRNVRGLLNGNKQSLTTGVAVAATLAYYAHQTGYDKVALQYTKKKYYEAKRWVRMKRGQIQNPKTTIQ